MTQLDLSYESELDRKFRAWLGEHPVLAYRFLALARQALGSGRSRWGAKAVWERLRWEGLIEKRGRDEDYALDNNMVSRLARWAIQEEPRLESLFELRRLRS